jgi:tripartite-type tricarboxylate transporter receptor subunit TctC
MRTKNIVVTMAAALAAVLPASIVVAQDYPTKPISLIIGRAAGGTSDVQGRVLAKLLAEELGQPVNVINKPGGAGSSAAIDVKNNKPDGYSMYFGGSTTFTFNTVEAKVDFSLEDFRYPMSLSVYQEAIVSTPAKPYKTFKELVAHSKANPGATFAAHSQIAKLVMSAIFKQEGMDVRMVPTQGGAQTVPLLLGNQIDFGYSAGVHSQYTPTGQMTVLAAMGDQRMAAYPDVPTLKELGYDVAFDTYTIVAIHKDTPEPVVQKLTAALDKAYASKEFTEICDKLEFPRRQLKEADLTSELKRQRGIFENLLKENR